LQAELGKRERQIMDVLFRKGRATVAEVRRELAQPPTYSAVRGMLRFLEEKGLVTHDQDGVRYVYRPAMNPRQARTSALKHVVRTFFNGSAKSAVAALVDLSDADLSSKDRQQILQMIEKAGKEGR
jgi:BlaI family transcriptional regulator, penicillinase repressor